MRRILYACILSCCMCASVLAERTVYLASLSWPPYAYQGLEQGASVAVAKAAFAAMGYRLVVDFYPWSRTLNLANDVHSKYVGYFPEYYATHLTENFVFSDVIGSGPLGFAEQITQNHIWQSLEELSAYTIGVVHDYINTTELDALLASGKLHSSEVINDKLNLLKLANGRIDLAVIDQNVMAYLMASDHQVSAVKNQIRFNPHLLEDKQLFVCFKKSHAHLAGIFNQGLKKIDAQKIQAEYLAKMR